MPQNRLKCGKPDGCDCCLFAYPEGCLHTLNESERNTLEMNRVMDAFNSFTDFCDASSPSSRPNGLSIDFWDRPENARHVDEKMVRFVLFMVIKLVVQKEKILPHWKSHAEQYFVNGVMLLSGMIECGSMAAASDAAMLMLNCYPQEEANTLEKKHPAGLSETSVSLMLR
jgi:hypothetical protein